MVLPTAEGKAPHMSPDGLPLYQPSKQQRVLACVLCQQRKVKCDRKFPCTNCIKSRAQCVPATKVARQRRRRFPERELLERLRKYEDLLRQNSIKFEPLHRDSVGERESPSAKDSYDSADEQPKAVGSDWSSPSTTFDPGNVYEAKYALPKKLPHND
jgi:Fungal Zn(2)-Cys(6) binuclear cluster domain